MATEAADVNVVSMEEALRDTYRDLVRWDQVAHKMLRHLRARIYALRLAQDPEFLKEAEAAHKQLFS